MKHRFFARLVLLAAFAVFRIDAAAQPAPKTYERNATVGGVEEPGKGGGDAPAAQPPARPLQRPSLAVMPFTVTIRTFFDYFTEQDISLLTDKFVTALVQTRKFDVVERRRVESVLEEHQFSDTDLVDPARAIEVGRMIGADYLLMGSFSVFSVKVEYKEIPYTSKLNEIIMADVIVDMRIVETKTGRIVSAEKGDVGYIEKHMVDSRRAVNVTPRFLDELQRHLIDQLTQKVIDAIYPIKIASCVDGRVVLNRGEGGGLVEGEILQVFTTGNVVRDPDTGEVLGVEESPVGRIRVTQVLPKFSKAEVVSGDPNLPRGGICRRTAPEKPEAGPPAGQTHRPAW